MLRQVISCSQVSRFNPTTSSPHTDPWCNYTNLHLLLHNNPDWDSRTATKGCVGTFFTQTFGLLMQTWTQPAVCQDLKIPRFRRAEPFPRYQGNGWNAKERVGTCAHTWLYTASKVSRQYRIIHAGWATPSQEARRETGDQRGMSGWGGEDEKIPMLKHGCRQFFFLVYFLQCPKKYLYCIKTITNISAMTVFAQHTLKTWTVF